MAVREKLAAMGIEEPQLSRLADWVFDTAATSTRSVDDALYVIRWAYQSRRIDAVDVQAKLRELVGG